MGNRQFTNNATSILAATITNTSTSVQCSTGEGSLFPAITGTQYFTIAVQDNSGNTEYMKVTAVSGDLFTVVRAQEGSTAIGFTADLARIELRADAGAMGSFYQKEGDTLTGPMNLGAQTVTNGTLGTGISLEACTEIVNTPLRGATGLTTNQILVPADGTSATMGGNAILTSASILPVFTVGMILLWAGAAPNIPAGWQLCNGTNGTPDLRDQFVVGAGNSYTLDEAITLSYTTSAVSAGTPTINPITLSVADLPVHEHPFDYFFGNGSAVVVNPGGSSPGNYITGSAGAGTRVSYAGSPAGSGSAFTPTAAALGTHSHTVGVSGGYGLYYIMFVG